MGNSHAVSYAYLAYYTLALKMKYPATFLAASMSEMISQSKEGWKDKLSDYIEEARTMGLRILPPSVNDSIDVFIPHEEAGAIRIGLRALSGIGGSMASKFVEVREQGEFSSIYDIVSRGGLRIAPLKTLAQIGSLNEFLDQEEYTVFMFDRKPAVRYMNRLMEEKYEKILTEISGLNPGDLGWSWAMKAGVISSLDEAQLTKMALSPKDVVNVQMYRVNKIEMAWLLVNYYNDNIGKKWLLENPQIIGVGEPPKITKKDILEFEKEALGCYVSGHPVEYIKRPASAIKISDVEKGHTCIVGLPTRVSRKVSVRGRKYLVGRISDETGSIKFLAFGADGVEEKFGALLNNNIVLIRGNKNPGEDTIIVEYAAKMEE